MLFVSLLHMFAHSAIGMSILYPQPSLLGLLRQADHIIDNGDSQCPRRAAKVETLFCTRQTGTDVATLV